MILPNSVDESYLTTAEALSAYSAAVELSRAASKDNALPRLATMLQTRERLGKAIKDSRLQESECERLVELDTLASLAGQHIATMVPAKKISDLCKALSSGSTGWWWNPQELIPETQPLFARLAITGTLAIAFALAAALCAKTFGAQTGGTNLAGALAAALLAIIGGGTAAQLSLGWIKVVAYRLKMPPQHSWKLKLGFSAVALLSVVVALAKLPLIYRDALLTRALQISRSGAPTAAIRVLEMALIVDPNFPATNRHLASFYEETGDLVAAKKFYQSAVIADPSDLSTQIGLARMEIISHDAALALDRLIRFYGAAHTDRHPDVERAALLRHIGWAMLELNQEKAALDMLEESTRLHLNPDTLYLTGLAHEKLGNAELSISLYKKAVKSAQGSKEKFRSEWILRAFEKASEE